jgi:predicted polyphosphate/ATP-dependent NAD kinase
MSPSASAPKIGFIINPIAGMGGRLGLHGTDGNRGVLAHLAKAKPTSTDRARRALKLLVDLHDELLFYAAHGDMGGVLLNELGIEFVDIGSQLINLGIPMPSASDTISLVRKMEEENIDVILFAGGDGTARDIFSVIGNRIPIIGIPCGVKMRSGVFAKYPEGAGDIILDLAKGSKTEVVNGEILDVFELPCGSNDNASTFYGVARTINSRVRLQSPKLNGTTHDAGLSALAEGFAECMEPDRLYLFGPGSTTNLFLNALRVFGTTSGIDAVYNGKLIAQDLTEVDILQLLAKFPLVTLILGVIGGQGFLVGRGNQQLSSQILKSIGSANIYVAAGARKIAAIVPARLYVDVEGNDCDAIFPTYFAVHTAPGRTMMCKLVSNNSQIQSVA